MLVVSPDCPHCTHLKSELKERGLLEKVTVIDATTKEGAAFTEKHGIKGVPECVVIEDGNVKVCSDTEFQKLVNEGT